MTLQVLDLCTGLGAFTVAGHTVGGSKLINSVANTWSRTLN